MIAVVFFAGVAVGVLVGLVLSGWAERRVRNDVARRLVVDEAIRILKDGA